MKVFNVSSRRGNLFPQHLVKAITDKWDHLVTGSDYDRPQLPSRVALRNLLEICYLVSLETDEGRGLKFTVCYTLNNDKVRYHSSNNEVECWRFDQPRDFTVAEIRRLAATTDLDSSAIWISSPIQNQENLKVHGLLNPGSSWASARRAFSYIYNPPPSGLNIRITGPGRLHVYQGSYLVASLSSGRIQDQGAMTITDCFGVLGFIGEGFNKMNEFIENPDLYLTGMNPLDHEPLKERHNFAWTAYLNTILALVNVVQAKGHGGALIVVRDDSAVLKDRACLRIKYLFRPETSSLRQRYVQFIRQRNQFHDLLWQREDFSEFPNESLIAANAKTEQEFKSLMETITFIGNLAGADGAIVVTQSLKVIGFSTEINIQGQMDAKVFAVTDAMKKQKTNLDVEQFGMRHRSAIKFCSATEDAIVFVISQDGDVSLVWRENAGIMVKKGVNTTSANMVFA